MRSQFLRTTTLVPQSLSSPSIRSSREWTGTLRKLCRGDEVREISRNGIQIDSHTVIHPQLHSLCRQSIQRKIVQSKEWIEDKLGVDIRPFAYPFAFPQQDKPFIRSLRDILHSNGYRRGVCTIIGRAHRDHNPFLCLDYPLIPMTICSSWMPS